MKLPPEEVLAAARKVVRWAADNELRDWTIMGIGPRRELKERFTPYRTLDYIKTDEDLEAYVQERIRTWLDYPECAPGAFVDTRVVEGSLKLRVDETYYRVEALEWRRYREWVDENGKRWFTDEVVDD